MREIKFRGFNGEKWRYGDLIHDSCNGHELIFIDDNVERTRHSVDKDTVGQFTGLLDAEGREIYEGDVIEVKRGCYVKDGFRTDFIFHSVVFWHKNGFMHKGPGIFSDSFDNVKVIGNVHDNPGLLDAAHD